MGRFRDRSPTILLSFIIGLSLSLISCTRSVEDLSVNVSIPVNSSKVHASVSATEKLESIIVNIHVPGQANPWFYNEFEYKNTSFQGYINIPNVPRVAGVVVQVLGIYEDTLTGTTRISYGGVPADLTRVSQVTVNLATQNHVEKMAHLTGRYLNASAPHPTGSLVGYFQPADGLPRMKVWEGVITSGWFEAMALQDSGGAGMSSALTFVVETDKGVQKQVLFDHLRLKEFSASDYRLQTGPLASPTDIPLSASRMIVSRPKTYRKDNSFTEIDGPQILFLGFFGPGTTASHKVCYPNVSEGLMHVKTEMSPGVVEPLDVDLTVVDASGTKVKVLNGGTADVFDQHYSHNGTCSHANANHLLVRHNFLGYRGEEALGIKPPFKAFENLNASFPEFLKAKFAVSHLALEWMDLAGVDEAVDSDGVIVTGYDLFYRPRPSSGSGEGDSGRSDIEKCSSLTSRLGFSLVTSVADTTGVVESYNVTTLPGGVTLNSSNWMNYDFAVCAHGLGVDGSKVYVGNYIRTHCSGDCTEMTHTGWAPAGVSANLLANDSFNAMSPRPGAVTQVIGKVFGTAPEDHLTKIEVQSPASFSANDEALIVVQSEGMNACSIGSQDVNVGFSHSTRVVKVVAGIPNYIYIPKGSWVDELEVSALGATPDPGAGHCFVQIVKVPHFRDFTMANSVQLSGTNFDFDTTQGGVIALRVNGTMTLGQFSSIDVSLQGFEGGDASNVHGASHLGNNSSTYQSGAAEGKAITNAGGGGGAGVVGNGGGASVNGALGGASFGAGLNGAPWFFAFGGGGGGGDSSSAPHSGSDGGGFVLISTDKYRGPASDAPSIKANGGMASSTEVGGGGGGGAVNVFMKDAQGLISLQASGGDGGNNNGTAAGPGFGGNGGGGFISAMICNLDDASNASATTTAQVYWNTSNGLNSHSGSDGSQVGVSKTQGLKGASGPYSWACGQ